MKRDSTLGGIPNGGVLIQKGPTYEYDILTYDDGAHPVYALRAWVGGRDMGYAKDLAEAPITFVSKAMLRDYLSAIGWQERVLVATSAMLVGGD